MVRDDSEARLRQEFAALADIPSAEWTHFWAQVRERRYDPKEHLFREGRRAAQIHYILSGLVRVYYHEDDREVVRGFDYEGRWVTAYESVLTAGPAMMSGQALEPTRTLSFSGEVLQRLYQRHPCWDRFGRRILELQWLRQVDKDRRFRVHKPEAHYRLLIKRKSPLIDRVPLNQLASFLQVTPETLSRFRARMRPDRPHVTVES